MVTKPGVDLFLLWFSDCCNQRFVSSVERCRVVQPHSVRSMVVPVARKCPICFRKQRYDFCTLFLHAHTPRSRCLSVLARSRFLPPAPPTARGRFCFLLPLFFVCLLSHIYICLAFRRVVLSVRLLCLCFVLVFFALLQWSFWQSRAKSSLEFEYR